MDFTTAETFFQYSIPEPLKKANIFQEENPKTLVHKNYIGRYNFNFALLKLSGFEESDSLPPEDLYNCDLNNIFHVVPFMNDYINDSEEITSKLKEGEKLFPFAIDLDGDNLMFLFFSNMRSEILGISREGGGEVFDIIAPDFDHLFPMQDGELVYTETKEFYELENTKLIFEYYKKIEEAKGMSFDFDAEGYDTITDYENFLVELFKVLAEGEFTLKEILYNEESDITTIKVNETVFETSIAIDGWFDEAIIESLNSSLAEDLKGRIFEIDDNPKYLDQTVKIYLKKV